MSDLSKGQRVLSKYLSEGNTPSLINLIDSLPPHQLVRDSFDIAGHASYADSMPPTRPKFSLHFIIVCERSLTYI